MRKPDFAVQLICTFVFTTRTVQHLLYLYQNFKILAFFFEYTGQFVLDLVGKPEDLFSLCPSSCDYV